MSAAAPTIRSEQPPVDPQPGSAGAWAEIRDDADLQFSPVEVPEIVPPEPGWLEEMLNALFRVLAEWLAPVGDALGRAWPWLQWVLLAAAISFALLLLWRLYQVGAGAPKGARVVGEEDGWQPDRAASLALLEDADALAAAGRFDEATRLLLQRSVGQIAAARPDWVEPASTARELAALPALPETARTAFRVIADRVERSLFALSALDRGDWEAARAAYAEFALARLTSRELPA
jgi:hypothetical protein